MNYLRYYRRRLGMTQAQLAKKSRVSMHTICNYETGRYTRSRNGTQRKVLLGLGMTWADRERVWPSQEKRG